MAPIVVESLVAEGKSADAIAAYAGLLTFTAYTAVGIKAYEPKFNYKQIFEERSGEVATYAEGSTGEQGECLAELYARYAKDIQDFLLRNPQKTVTDYPALKPDFNENPTVKKFLFDNQPGTKKINAPVLIIQGTHDPVIPLRITASLHRGMYELGTNVTFVQAEGADHNQAIVQKNPELLQFIQKYMPAA